MDAWQSSYNLADSGFGPFLKVGSAWNNRDDLRIWNTTVKEIVAYEHLDIQAVVQKKHMGPYN